MIRYTLICNEYHQFDSWFQSSDGFDALADAGHLSCAICGSSDVKRSLMAPSVQSKSKAPELKSPQSDAETALTQMRKDVEANSEYVGEGFAKEARKMHDGDAPERAIYGEAKLDEAKKLIEDGVPVAPLPFMPKRKSN
ncbi:DUF1178 family protein [Octadecabacter sp. 1_MG-2023]|uniref:DUF1178 family protein n=1 Tax=unclassified Octadecabacter TaxID=196158 RepID=UPI001C09B8CF|nr:DUF1178 family protein [Octadecabacter sp. 1_MG-2023]MBU2992039.1 DUF1178 family protein [Octadecabacter sp. B2R22]MDO6736014.1 DUF1178 family protein [Octadecabacter sp. 1_MG-2023]